MRQLFFLTLALLLPMAATGQNAYKAVPKSEAGNRNLQEVYNQLHLIQSGHWSPEQVKQQSGPSLLERRRQSRSFKTSDFEFVEVGSASNPYTMIQARQNQVFANDRLDMVGWIHRNNVLDHPGSPETTVNGVYRIDYSIDANNQHNTPSTWVTDIGPLTPTPYTNADGSNNLGRGRYPQCVPYVPTGATGISDVYFPFTGALTDGTSWGNIIWGVARELDNFCAGANCNLSGADPNVFAVSEQNVKSNFSFLGPNQSNRSLIPGGLTQGRDGEFWTVDVGFVPVGANDGITQDSLVLFKGVLDTITNSMSWGRDTILEFPIWRNAEGDATMFQFNMGFAPDGQTGWICALADPAEGPLTDPNAQIFEIHPTLFRTDDGGQTWNGPIPVYLNGFPNVSDSLLTLFTDGNGNVTDTSSGFPMANNFDMTVDSAGNPHILVTVSNRSRAEFDFQNNPADVDSVYFFQPGARRNIWDVTTFDGGQTWCAKYVADLNAYEGQITGSDLQFSNYPQASRTEDGSRLFFTWTDDADTGATADAMVPDIAGRAYRVSDEAYSPQVFWSETAPFNPQFTSAAPTVISVDGTQEYMVPAIFTLDINSFGVEVPPTRFGFADSIRYNESDFVAPAVDLGIDNFVSPATNICGAANNEPVNVVLRNNGSTTIDTFTIYYSIDGGAEVSETVTSSTLAPGDTLDFTFNQTANLNNNGTYQIRVRIEAPLDNTCRNNSLTREVVNVGGQAGTIFTQDTLQGCDSLVVDSRLSGLNYTWTVGGATGSNQTYTLTQPTNGQVLNLTVTDPNNAGCSVTDSVVGVVNTSPTNNLPQSDPDTCAGSSLTLSANSTNPANVSFQWSRNGAVIPNQTGNTLTATQSGAYSVTVTNDQNGCSSTEELDVMLWDVTVDLELALNAVYEQDEIEQRGDTFLVCTAKSLQAENATSIGADFTWTKNGTVDPNNTSGIYLLDTIGTNFYKVDIADTLGCSSATDSILVSTFDTLTVTLGNNIPELGKGTGNPCPPIPCPSGYTGPGYPGDTIVVWVNAETGATPVTDIFWTPQPLASRYSLVSGDFGDRSADISGTDTVAFTWATQSGTMDLLADVFSGNCSNRDIISQSIQRFGNNCPTTEELVDLGVCETVISISERELNANISVYPNPSSALFTVQIDTEGYAKLSYSIMDLQGRTVKSGEIEVDDLNSLQVDLSNEPSGVYLLRLSDEDSNRHTHRRLIRR